MRSRLVLLRFLFPTVLALLDPVALLEATTLERLSLGEMTRLSETIVHGTVLSTRSRWNEDHSMIVTDVHVQVAETVKGGDVTEIVVTQLGGRVGPLRTEVPGAAAFQRGEEVVLFLVQDSIGRTQVTGLSQGRFEVREDPQTGTRLVRGLGLDLPATAAVDGGDEATAPATPTTLPLHRFLDEVRSLVDRETPETPKQ